MRRLVNDAQVMAGVVPHAKQQLHHSSDRDSGGRCPAPHPPAAWDNMPRTHVAATGTVAGQSTGQVKQQRLERQSIDGCGVSSQQIAPGHGARMEGHGRSRRCSMPAVPVFDYSVFAADADASSQPPHDMKRQVHSCGPKDVPYGLYDAALGTFGCKSAPRRLSDAAGKLHRPAPVTIPDDVPPLVESASSPVSMFTCSASCRGEPGELLQRRAAAACPAPAPFRRRMITDPGDATATGPATATGQQVLSLEVRDHQLPDIRAKHDGRREPLFLPRPAGSWAGEEGTSTTTWQPCTPDQGPDAEDALACRSVSLENLKRCRRERERSGALTSLLSTPSTANSAAGAAPPGEPLLGLAPFRPWAALPGTKADTQPHEAAVAGNAPLRSRRGSLPGSDQDAAYVGALSSLSVPGFECGPVARRASLSGLEASCVGKRRSSSGQELVYKGAAHQDKADDILFENLLPHRDAERAMQAALAVMQAANVADRKELDWQGQNEALNDCRRLIKHHPTLVSQHLFELVTASLPAIDALRSFTAKIALVMYQELFSQLGQAMDAYVGNVAAMLLKRAAEVSNAGRENFLSLEARAALGDMCHNVSSGRAMSALLVNANHKSPSVRVCVAQHLDLVLDLARRELVLWPPPASNWAVMERLFKVVLGFLSEGALETRTFGKRLLWSLKQMLSAAELSKLMSLQQPGAAAQRKLQETVEAMTEQPPLPHSSALGSAASSQPGAGAGAGAGACRVPAPSPRLPSNAAQIPELRTPSLSPSPDHSSCISASSRPLPPTPAELCTLAAADVPSPVHPGPKALPPPPPLDPHTLAKLVDSLSSKDFRERVEGLKSLEPLIPQLAAAGESQLQQLLDIMMLRMGDGNSKVTTQALLTLGLMFEGLRERVTLALHTLVPALAANLASANEKIRSAAMQATDKLVAAVPAAALLPGFCQCLAAGNLRNKITLVDKLEPMIDAVCQYRPQLVLKYAVPAAVCLGNDVKGGAEVKVAANRLFAILARRLGQQLLEHTAGMSQSLQKQVEEVVAAVQGQG